MHHQPISLATMFVNLLSDKPCNICCMNHPDAMIDLICYYQWKNKTAQVLNQQHWRVLLQPLMFAPPKFMTLVNIAIFKNILVNLLINFILKLPPFCTLLLYFIDTHMPIMYIPLVLCSYTLNVSCITSANLLFLIFFLEHL